LQGKGNPNQMKCRKGNIYAVCGLTLAKAP
jgi:hypothetical protein